MTSFMCSVMSGVAVHSRLCISSIKRQLLHSVPLHCFIGFRVVAGAWSGRYLQVHNLDFY